MKRTIGRIGCLAVAVAIFAACDPSTPTRLEPTPSLPGASATAGLVAGDTLTQCPEVHIPELPCIDRDQLPPRPAGRDD